MEWGGEGGEGMAVWWRMGKGVGCLVVGWAGRSWVEKEILWDMLSTVPFLYTSLQKLWSQASL